MCGTEEKEADLGKGEVKLSRKALRWSHGSSAAEWPFRSVLSWGKGAGALHLETDQSSGKRYELQSSHPLKRSDS